MLLCALFLTILHETFLSFSSFSLVVAPFLLHAKFLLCIERIPLLSSFTHSHPLCGSTSLSFYGHIYLPPFLPPSTFISPFVSLLLFHAHGRNSLVKQENFFCLSFSSAHEKQSCIYLLFSSLDIPLCHLSFLSSPLLLLFCLCHTLLYHAFSSLLFSLMCHQKRREERREKIGERREEREERENIQWVLFRFDWCGLIKTKIEAVDEEREDRSMVHINPNSKLDIQRS